jgi:pSer/pThr/pTyr-binding forkhead associated (FHA) protein
LKCPVCWREIAEGALECPHCAAVFRSETKAMSRDEIPTAPPSTGDTPQPAPKKDIEARVLVSGAIPAPVELSEGRGFRIGRDRGSAVCLPSTHVSRVHAEVTAEKGHWFVADLNSRNGTFVNGERVIKRRLKDGDKISTGPFEITYRELTRAEAADLREEKRRGAADATARVKLAKQGEGVYGDVKKVSVVEMVQLLSQNRKTGCLTILEMRAGAEARTIAERRIWFQDGAIVHADSGQEQGEPAVAPALAVQEGKFAFEPDAHSEKVTIQTPTATLLLNSIS